MLKALSQLFNWSKLQIDTFADSEWMYSNPTLLTHAHKLQRKNAVTCWRRFRREGSAAAGALWAGAGAQAVPCARSASWRPGPASSCPSCLSRWRFARRRLSRRNRPTYRLQCTRGGERKWFETFARCARRLSRLALYATRVRRVQWPFNGQASRSELTFFSKSSMWCFSEGRNLRMDVTGEGQDAFFKKVARYHGVCSLRLDRLT